MAKFKTQPAEYGKFDKNNLAFVLAASLAGGPSDRMLDAEIICAFPMHGFGNRKCRPHLKQAGRIVCKPVGSFMAPELTGSVHCAVDFAVRWSPIGWRKIVGNAAVQCRSPEWLARKIVQLTLESMK